MIVPPLVKRLFYCSDQDVKELNKFLSFVPSSDSKSKKDEHLKGETHVRELFPEAFPPDVYLSLVGSHIINSELLTVIPNPDLSVLEEKAKHADDALTFSLGQTSTLQPSHWPRYQLDKKYYDTFGVTDRPYMVIHGELDPQTSYGFFMQTRKSWGPKEFAVSVPYGPHQSSDDGPGQHAEGATCTRKILTDFILEVEGGSVNTACLKEIPFPDFEGVTKSSQMISQYLFGTTSLWGED